MYPTDKIQLSDQEIIQGLIDRDNEITRLFFFEKCRPLFRHIIRFVFSYEVDYDEFVNELYQYLMENDAVKLKQFQYRSTIYQWLKVLAIRYFIRKRDEMIEDASKESLYSEDKIIETETDKTAKIDLENLLGIMENKRYEFVIRKLMLEEVESEVLAESMGITTANLYNIKKRAMNSLTRIALNNIPNDGKKR